MNATTQKVLRNALLKLGYSQIVYAQKHVTY